MAVKKKDRARDASFVAFVVEQLVALGDVRSKSMFGGYGVYARETFFACVDEGRLYFRVDDTTRPRYEERGMGPFAPMPQMVMKTYYEVPVEVIEDASELTRWAREAMAAAPKKKAKATRAAKSAKAAATRTVGAARKEPAAAKKKAPRVKKRK